MRLPIDNCLQAIVLFLMGLTSVFVDKVLMLLFSYTGLTNLKLIHHFQKHLLTYYCSK